MTPARIKRLEELRALARELRADQARVIREMRCHPVGSQERLHCTDAADAMEERLLKLRNEWAAALWGSVDG